MINFGLVIFRVLVFLCVRSGNSLWGGCEELVGGGIWSVWYCFWFKLIFVEFILLESFSGGKEARVEFGFSGFRGV